MSIFFILFMIFIFGGYHKNKSAAREEQFKKEEEENDDIETGNFRVFRNSKNYLSDFIYLAEYKFHFNEKSKKSKSNF